MKLYSKAIGTTIGETAILKVLIRISSLCSRGLFGKKKTRVQFDLISNFGQDSESDFQSGFQKRVSAEPWSLLYVYICMHIEWTYI